MGASERSKGARRERQVVHLHHDALIPAEKISGMYEPGEDLRIADEFRGEVKARKDGAGWKLLERWLEGADLLFLWRDRRKPLVCMEWETYTALMRGYLRD